MIVTYYLNNLVFISISDLFIKSSAGFNYRLDRLKPRVSTFMGVSGQGIYTIFNILIRRSDLCCHNVLYFLNNPSVILLTQLHSISEYCTILNTPHHLCLYWNRLNTLSRGWFGGLGAGAPGARPRKNGRKYDFLHNIVIFHTKYPQHFRASLRFARLF